ncbi:alpha/beta hydrolase family protein [Microbacterium sp. p3-SID336]|uniref:alpha/beta hydrolase family protein n=1 Tax=Microbacterium sp. p3-SID336 TaxID=2916212 RepID=UPI0021A57CDC|nr:alpha/beta hydrolase family protein [Microbacterium sp. p3-SID336]MCT1478651.1 alpha/beta hydrolase family protein [Microbacterium sp. p3-SID336]
MSLPGLIDDPARGDVGAVNGSAAAFTTRAGSSRARKTDADTALASLTSMTSTSADALGARVLLLAQRLGEAEEGLGGISAAITAYASDLEALKADAARKLRAAQNAYDHIFVRRAEALNAASEFVTGWALPWDAVLPSWMYLDDPGYLHRWQNAIDSYYTARDAYNALGDERRTIDQRAVSALAAVPLITAVTQGGKVGLSGFTAASLIWAGDVNAITAESLAGLGAPDIIRATWNAMDEETQAALLAASSLLLGNLNGIPIQDRVTANHKNIRDEIARREAEIARLQALVDDLKTGDRADAWEAKGYLDEIAKLRAPIEPWQRLLEQDYTWWDQSNQKHVEKKAGARVVVFDPRADAIATYQGPIDPVTGDIPAWIRNVAVSVPGTTTTITDFGDGTGSSLYRAAVRENGPSTAVFQWAGGTFPQLELPGPTDASYSRDLAPKLVDFVAGIDRPADSTLTVLGHSYGGATVGLAEQAGLKADRILYVSAAGMGKDVAGLSDFPYTADVPHYSMMARNDAVVGLIQGKEGEWHAIHGQSPLTAEGVIRLETGWMDHGDPDSTDLEDHGFPSGIESHSSVMKPGTTAFHNIVEVIIGGEAITWAPNEYVTGGYSTIVVDGIDAADYEPQYVKID